MGPPPQACAYTPRLASLGVYGQGWTPWSLTGRRCREGFVLELQVDRVVGADGADGGDGCPAVEQECEVGAGVGLRLLLLHGHADVPFLSFGDGHLHLPE